MGKSETKLVGLVGEMVELVIVRFVLHLGRLQR